jgi:hypothetical protein
MSKSKKPIKWVGDRKGFIVISDERGRKTRINRYTKAEIAAAAKLIWQRIVADLAQSQREGRARGTRRPKS